ncbi:MAG TPA: hypothetical protein VHM65_05340 [Candidatus Lustribacter sp.]|nr:hypothetical protein [Candidatus Lustribacter sp.]
MRRPNRTSTAVALWLLVVGASAAFAWFMINRAGREVMEGNQSIAVLARAATGRPSSSSSPASPPATPTSAPTASTSSAGPGPTAESAPVTTTTRSVTLRGGTVIAACAGSVVSLRSATPRNGWRLESPETEGDVLKVTFEAEGEDKSEVAVACVGGTPTFSTS